VIPTTPPATPILVRWDDLPSQEVTSGIHRRFLTASRLTVARFTLAPGTSVPSHAHEHEQVSYVVRGMLRFRIGGGSETIVRGGEVLQIPSWIEHGVDALEETEVLDVFSPVRQDWVDGTDSYFRKAGVESR
jgi:quercetin dioxygenase-like cupin family protein